MIINAIYDSFALSADQSVRDDISKAIQILEMSIGQFLNGTINIKIGYSTADHTLPINIPNETTSSADVNTGTEFTTTYTNLRNHLLVSSDVDWASTSLPNAASVNGVSNFTVSGAESKLFGFRNANDPGIDGYVMIGTGFSGNELISAALHEITHAMGRVPDGVNASTPPAFDLFRFLGVGSRLYANNNPSVAAYFSMDHGQDDIADFGLNSDPSDFLNNSGLTPNDPLNENVGDLGAMTDTDLLMMSALGFSTSAPWSGDGATDYIGDLTGGGVKGDILQLEPNGSADALITNGSSYAWAAHWGSGFTTSDRLADFSGEGRSDVIQFYNGANYVALSNGVGFNAWTTWGSGGGTVNDRLVDLNADGKTDLLQFYNGNMYGALSTGSSFGAWKQWATGASASDKAADLNGDGRADIIQFYNGANYVALSTGTGFGPWTTWGTGGGTPSDQLVDLNGDGKKDLLQFYNGKMYAALSTGSSFGAWKQWGTGATSTDQAADFTGDGKADLLQIYNGAAYVAVSNGTSFGAFTKWQTGLIGNELIADENGDGRKDLVQLYSDGGAYVALSTGSGFAPWQLWGNSPGDTSALTPADFTSSYVPSGTTGSANSGLAGGIDGPSSDVSLQATNASSLVDLLGPATPSVGQTFAKAGETSPFTPVDFTSTYLSSGAAGSASAGLAVGIDDSSAASTLQLASSMASAGPATSSFGQTSSLTQQLNGLAIPLA